jgi:hypothetical protein
MTQVSAEDPHIVLIKTTKLFQEQSNAYLDFIDGFWYLDNRFTTSAKDPKQEHISVYKTKKSLYTFMYHLVGKSFQKTNLKKTTMLKILTGILQDHSEP